MSGLRTPIALLGLAGLVALSAVAVRAVTANAKGCSGGPKLSIVAAPAMVSALQEVGARWQRERTKAGDDCVRIEINPVAPAEVAEALVAHSAGRSVSPASVDEAVGWVSDSVAWLDRVRAVEPNALTAVSPSIAMSPVVIAAPEALARTIAPNGKALSYGDLAGLAERTTTDKSIVLGSTDPRQDGAALAGSIMFHDAVGARPERLVDLVGIYRGVRVMPDVTTLTTSFARNMIAPMSEQSVLSFDATRPAASLSMLPVTPLTALDYPFALIAGQQTQLTRLADEFRSALSTPAYLEVFARHGFRSQSGATGPGFPAGNGALASQVEVRPLAEAPKVAQALSHWTATKTPARMLVLLDVTKSTGASVPAGSGYQRRMDLMSQAATGSLALLGDDSVSGLWVFSGGDAAGHREVVPVAPLGVGQRSRLEDAVKRAAITSTDVCALHESVLAAYQLMRDQYWEGAPNTILVLTDGGNSKPGISRQRLRAELEKLADPARPVRVVLMGVGSDVDMPGLTAIAEATGGTAVRVGNPAQIKSATATVLFGP